jgi:AraC family transcriptional regulator, regulatory protein of adaptative response / DNA-3-methyladenine glycosylase II
VIDAAALEAFLAARCVDGVEEVDGPVYRRALRGEVIEARAERLTAGPLEDVAAADAHLATVPALAPLVRARPGVAVPGTFDPAELAIRAVLGQQVSVAAARTLAGRLSAAHGTPLAAPRGGVVREFVAPAALAELDPEDLPMPRARGRALVGLARALADGLPVTREALLELPGIGPWTADYVALRTGDPDVFLAGDLGVRHALERLGAGDARALARAVSPYGSYATVRLWLA